MLRRFWWIPVRDPGRPLGRPFCCIGGPTWIAARCSSALTEHTRALATAPLYDIVSTVVYPELTTRLAMSIDGARHLDEVDDEAWVKLAGDTGFRPAFVSKAVNDLLQRAAVEGANLATTAAHDNDTARQINERVQRLAATSR